MINLPTHLKYLTKLINEMSFILPHSTSSSKRPKVYPYFPSNESDLLSTDLKKSCHSGSNKTIPDATNDNYDGKSTKETVLPKNMGNDLEKEFHMPGLTRTSTIYHKKITYKPESEYFFRNDNNYQPNIDEKNAYSELMHPEFEAPHQRLSYKKNKNPSESDLHLVNKLRKDSYYQIKNIKSAQNINLNTSEFRKSTTGQFRKEKLKELMLFEEKFKRSEEGREDIFEKVEGMGNKKESCMKKFNMKMKELSESERKKENNVI